MAKYKSSNLQKYRDPIVRVPLSRFLKILSCLVNSLNVNNILDVGCGEGFVAKYLISHNKNLLIEGIDIDEQAILIARHLCPDATFRKGDISNNIDYPDKSFDLVLAIEIIEHLVNPNMGINEAKRISRKYCIFSVPFEPYFRIGNLLLGKNIHRWGNPPEHLWHWSTRKFNAFLLDHFAKIRMTVVFPWTIALCEV